MAGGLRRVSDDGASVALDDVSATEWRDKHFAVLQPTSVALDDVSATEWRSKKAAGMPNLSKVALDDVSATEWRM